MSWPGRASATARCAWPIASGASAPASNATRSWSATGWSTSSCFTRAPAAERRCAGLREQQVFIARLAEAVRAQRTLLEQLRVESAQVQEQWRGAATRKQAVGKVIEHARSEEFMSQEKRQQRELDELAIQPRMRR